jgi:hypothetical protein
MAPVAGEAGQVMIGQPGVVLLRSEQVGGEIIGGEEGVKSCQTNEPF